MKGFLLSLGLLNEILSCNEKEGGGIIERESVMDGFREMMESCSPGYLRFNL